MKLKEIGVLGQGRILVLGIWFLSLVILVVNKVSIEIPVFFSLVIFHGLVINLLINKRLIVKAYTKRNPATYYSTASLFILLLSLLPTWVVVTLFTDSEIALVQSIFNFFIQLIFTVPFSWWIYKRLNAEYIQRRILEREAHTNQAKFDFLRSQINPHFLFNILNSLYANAIDENADRTADSIQRLGDIMRFMLHDNQKKSIDISQEINYLENYIALQKMRTSSIDSIKISKHVCVPENSNLMISPMLLIPFVENAFKHGISLQVPSYIEITLKITGLNLNFQVKNSRHEIRSNDTERIRGGIGINNVKERLKILYEDCHELDINSSKDSFQINLNLKLTPAYESDRN